MAAMAEVRALFPTIEKYGVDDIYIGNETLPWVPYSADGAYFKPLRFNVRDGHWAVTLKVKGGGMLGRHQHHGPVTAFTVKGTWRYAEYDWVAGPGDMVHESPGVIHTLHCDDPEGMEVFFIVEGAIDYFGDDDTFAGQQTVFWFVDEYRKYCAENGLEVNDGLFY
jgi:hypothetical protein